MLRSLRQNFIYMHEAILMLFVRLGLTLLWASLVFNNQQNSTPPPSN